MQSCLFIEIHLKLRIIGINPKWPQSANGPFAKSLQCEQHFESSVYVFVFAHKKEVYRLVVTQTVNKNSIIILDRSYYLLELENSDKLFQIGTHALHSATRVATKMESLTHNCLCMRLVSSVCVRVYVSV